MVSCRICGKESRLISEILLLCRECVLEQGISDLKSIHHALRKDRNLSSGQGGNKQVCSLCLNNCRPLNGEKSFCGSKQVINGKTESTINKELAMLHVYKDSLPTNCCSSWFCPRGTNPPPRSYNLAVFFYYCSFHCLFCQNHQHWYPDPRRHGVKMDDLVDWVKRDESIACVCFFGGTPEPHFP
ncbi:MAG: radical SAM protein, partial [Candidatus Hodarchaeales archaeon]